MHSGDFQKKAPGPAASFFVYNGTMPEADEEQRKVQEDASPSMAASFRCRPCDRCNSTRFAGGSFGADARLGLSAEDLLANARQVRSLELRQRDHRIALLVLSF
jgi:hypothetical protein